jgi:hypothetical protein
MNIHEYQAKELLARFGVPVPAGHAAMNVEEAVAAAEQLPGPLYVVKAQIHAGGRGKGKFKELGPDAKGGVRLARSLDEVRAAAQDMLGNTLVTVQTGPAGKQVNRLYVTDGADIAKEYYLALLVDRKSGRIAFVVSTEGGMSIEDVAHETPEKIHSFTIDPATGFQPHHGRAVAHALGLGGDLNKQAQKVARQLYEAFLGTDASQIEINPLAQTEQGELLVLDAKVGFDANAMFRHHDLEALRDESEEDPMERRGGRSTTSPTSSWTAISAAWSTAPASRWRRWTSSSSMAPSPPISRRRRRRLEGEGDRGVQDHPLRSGGEGHIGQHLRRDHALRHHRRGHRRGGAGDRARRASGGAARRHQCRGRQGDPRRQRPRDRAGRRSGRCGAQDRRRGEGSGVTDCPSPSRGEGGARRAAAGG